MYDLTAPTTAAFLKPAVARDAVLVSDGRDAYAAFARDESILHVAIIASHGEHVYQGFLSEPPPSVNLCAFLASVAPRARVSQHG